MSCHRLFNLLVVDISLSPPPSPSNTSEAASGSYHVTPFQSTMDFTPDYEKLSPNSDTISPLPSVLRHGLRGVVVLACVSLLSTLLLFTHLTCKLIRYSIRRARRKARSKRLEAERYSHSSIDLHLGLDELHFGATKKGQRSPSPSEPREREFPPPNQFVVLLYNLLLADMHQAIAFFLNVVWVAKDGIFVRTSACWTQGLFISNGDLASSCFIATIALHTYLTIVREYKPPEWILNAWIVGTWIFVYGVTIAGITSTGNGKEAGGYFVRASAWVRSVCVCVFCFPMSYELAVRATVLLTSIRQVLDQ